MKNVVVCNCFVRKHEKVFRKLNDDNLKFNSDSKNYFITICENCKFNV